jgi:L-asparaginase/Glu-tRNA(Gln) amidotransferase subunit D
MPEPKDTIIDLVEAAIPSNIVCECERENIVEFDSEKLTNDILETIATYITRRK